MKVHQFARGLWDHEPTPSLSLGCCKTTSTLRPLAPKLPNTDTLSPNFDLKSFIRPESGPRKLQLISDHKREKTQVILNYTRIYVYMYVCVYYMVVPYVVVLT